MSLIKVLIYNSGELEKPIILLLVPTGVAAFNTNDTTVHSGLGINVGGNLYQLSEQHHAALRSEWGVRPFCCLLFPLLCNTYG